MWFAAYRYMTHDPNVYYNTGSHLFLVTKVIYPSERATTAMFQDQCSQTSQTIFCTTLSSSQNQLKRIKVEQMISFFFIRIN